MLRSVHAKWCNILFQCSVSVCVTLSAVLQITVKSPSIFSLNFCTYQFGAEKNWKFIHFVHSLWLQISCLSPYSSRNVMHFENVKCIFIYHSIWLYGFCFISEIWFLSPQSPPNIIHDLVIQLHIFLYSKILYLFKH